MDAIEEPNSKLRREVDPRDVKTFMTGNDISLKNAFETSAKTGINITELFNRVAEICLENDPDMGMVPKDKGVVEIGGDKENTKKKRSKCCE